jgi:hypothetical protein
MYICNFHAIFGQQILTPSQQAKNIATYVFNQPSNIKIKSSADNFVKNRKQKYLIFNKNYVIF